MTRFADHMEDENEAVVGEGAGSGAVGHRYLRVFFTMVETYSCM